MPLSFKCATPRCEALRGKPFLLLMVLIASLAACATALAANGKDRLEDYLQGLQSLESEFSQVTFNADRTRMSEARGTFYLKRPGLFRWEYETPVRQVIVADGKRVYLHDLDLEQVSHQSQNKALRGTPALLLAGGDPIDKHFRTRPIESTDGRDWVELTPKAADTDVVRIELGFGDRELDSLIMEDSFGQTTRLDFAATRRNPSLDPDLFKMNTGAMEEFLSFD